MHTLAKAQDQYCLTMLTVLAQKPNSLIVPIIPLHPVMTTLKMLGFDVHQVGLTLSGSILI